MRETQPVRREEEVDADRLGTYLSEHLGVADEGLAIEQFPAGSSNLTYLIKIAGDEYVLRRPPFGNTVKTAHDMRREYNVLAKLSPVYAPAPNPLLFCDDTSVIGSEFYLMERRQGLIIRGELPPPLQKPARSKGITTADLHDSHDARIAVCGKFIENLAALHALDYNAAGLGALGRPEGYNRRQVEGWTERYFAAKTHEWTVLENEILWLNDNIPTESGAALIHNDYKFDNIMLDPDDLTRITAILDWEMVTIGDPLMDLGTTLGYWMSREAGDQMLSMPFNPRLLMESVSRRDLAEMYSEASGRDTTNILFYYVFGTFKIAVIAQQIYARYIKGMTKDERFAGFDKFVAVLGQIAAGAIARGDI